MKTSLIKKSNTAMTFIDAIFGIVIAAAIYGSILYIPFVYKGQELETIVKDYTFKTGGSTPEVIKAAVIEDARKKLDIVLNPDDVQVTRNNERTRIQAKWRAVVELPFGYKIPRDFDVEYDRKQLN